MRPDLSQGCLAAVLLRRLTMTVDSAVQLTIGALAASAGVNVETIRYYQRIGLIVEPPRPLQGYRRYSAVTAERLRFIKRAQHIGFSLAEVAELLSLHDGDCAEARAIAERKRGDIEQRIADLNAVRHELDRLIDACQQDGEAQGACAMIQSLSGVGRD